MSEYKSFIHVVDEASIGRAGSMNPTVLSKSLGASTTAPLVVDLNEGAPQITIKAVISGTIAGIVCSFLALYYGLKVGVTPSLNILGGALGWATTIAIMKTGWFGTRFTPQENCVIQTISVSIYGAACPAFGFATGYLGLSKEAYEAVGPDMPGNNIEDVIDLTIGRGIVWSLALAAFGLFVAYPIRNYYIVKKRLLFPSGTATAYIISALHTSKENAARGVSIILKWFSLAFLVNMVTWCFDGLTAFPLFGVYAANQYTWTLDFDLGAVGIGLLLSMQVCSSMFAGAVVGYGFLYPWIDRSHQGNFEGAWFDEATSKSPYLGLFSYSLFAGLGIMLVQGIWGICCILGTVVVENVKERKRIKAGIELEEPLDPLQEQRDQEYMKSDFPLWLSIVGYMISGAFCIVILHFLYKTEWYQTLVALVIVPLLSIANTEGLGRTDWDMGSAYGKLAMFPIGAWNRNKSILPAIALCHTMISGTSAAATLLQDFKTGYLLGSNPTIMFHAQMFGTILGCVVTPLLFAMLRHVWIIPADPIKDPHAFLPGKFGPIFRTLAIVATGSGFDALPKYCLLITLIFIIITLVVDVIALVCEKYWPQVAQYLPEPSAFSIGLIVGATIPVEFFIGGLIGWLWARRSPKTAAEDVNYIASGAIAGSGGAVVVQCLGSMAGMKPAVEITWGPGADAATLGAGGWVAAGIAMVLCMATCYLLYRMWSTPRIQEIQLPLPLEDNQELGDEEP